jgi:hypothetical protein
LTARKLSEAGLHGWALMELTDVHEIEREFKGKIAQAVENMNSKVAEAGVR